MISVAHIKITGCPRDARDGDVQVFLKDYGELKSVIHNDDDSSGRVFYVKMACFGDQNALIDKISGRLFKDRVKVKVSLENCLERSFRTVPWLGEDKSNPFLFHPKDVPARRH